MFGLRYRCGVVSGERGGLYILCEITNQIYLLYIPARYTMCLSIRDSEPAHTGTEIETMLQYIRTTFRNGREFGFSLPYILCQLVSGLNTQVNVLTEI